MADSLPDIYKTLDKQRRTLDITLVLAYLPSIMAPGLRCLRLSDRVDFADESLETLITKPEARSQRAEIVHDLVKDLRNILDLAEKETSDRKGAEQIDLGAARNTKRERMVAM